MKQLQIELLEEAKQGMLTPEGAKSLTDEEITDIANVITASIVGGAYAAMDTFGKGSLMDLSNPALQNYMSSEIWNPERHDTTIRSRERGPYQNIFGETVYSRSNVPGIDLEKLGGKFEPQPPSHAIETAMRWMANGRMAGLLKNVVATFPFGQFIIVDKK